MYRDVLPGQEKETAQYKNEQNIAQPIKSKQLNMQTEHLPCMYEAL